MTSAFVPDLLRDQVAWVTGGGSGIGAQIAQTLAAHGSRVALTGRTEAKLEQTAAAIRAAGSEALVVTADVREPEALEAAVATIDSTWGRLDIAVAGAAGNFLCPAVALSANGFGTVIDIDLKGTFNTCKAAFPLLSRQGGGSIVAISATLQYTGTPMQVHASSAKAGIDAMVRGLAVEWGPAGVRVNAIAPGPIDDTPGMAKLTPPDAKDRITRSIPLQRWGTKDEVADSVLFLSSRASRWTTGSTLVVDGGQWLATSGLMAGFL